MQSLVRTKQNTSSSRKHTIFIRHVLSSPVTPIYDHIMSMLAESVRQLGVVARRGVLARFGHHAFATHCPATLRSVLLLEHDIAQACEFFRQGLGGRVLVATEGWAEIEVGGSGEERGSPGTLLLHLKKRDTDTRRNPGVGRREQPEDSTLFQKTTGNPDTRGATRSSTGSSTTDSNSVAGPDAAGSARTVPSTMLVFSVEDVQSCLMNMLQHGGHMDGRIEYSPDGTTHAVVRSPGGTSVGIVSGVHG